MIVKFIVQIQQNNGSECYNRVLTIQNLVIKCVEC